MSSIHLYRAMLWLGEELPEDEEGGATPFAPRCVKDVLEEELFASRLDLLTTLDMVFMDTTSLYFEGAGGQTLGRRGFSKDHRPDPRASDQVRRPGAIRGHVACSFLALMLKKELEDRLAAADKSASASWPAVVAGLVQVAPPKCRVHQQARR